MACNHTSVGSIVRYGIVGVGYFGAEMGRYLASREDAAVTVVHDPENAEAVAVELGARVADNVQELCTDGDVDVVVVASPNWAHLEPVALPSKKSPRGESDAVLGSKVISCEYIHIEHVSVYLVYEGDREGRG